MLTNFIKSLILIASISECFSSVCHCEVNNNTMSFRCDGINYPPDCQCLYNPPFEYNATIIFNQECSISSNKDGIYIHGSTCSYKTENKCTVIIETIKKPPFIPNNMVVFEGDFDRNGNFNIFNYIYDKDVGSVNVYFTKIPDDILLSDKEDQTIELNKPYSIDNYLSVRKSFSDKYQETREVSLYAKNKYNLTSEEVRIQLKFAKIDLYISSIRFSNNPKEKEFEFFFLNYIRIDPYQNLFGFKYMSKCDSAIFLDSSVINPNYRYNLTSKFRYIKGRNCHFNDEIRIEIYQQSVSQANLSLFLEFVDPPTYSGDEIISVSNNEMVQLFKNYSWGDLPLSIIFSNINKDCQIFYKSKDEEGPIESEVEENKHYSIKNNFYFLYKGNVIDEINSVINFRIQSRYFTLSDRYRMNLIVHKVPKWHEMWYGIIAIIFTCISGIVGLIRGVYWFKKKNISCCCICSCMGRCCKKKKDVKNPEMESIMGNESSQSP